MSTKLFAVGMVAIVCALVSATVASGQTSDDDPVTAEGSNTGLVRNTGLADSFKILSLEHLPAADAEKIIAQLFSDAFIITSALPATNQLILRAGDEESEMVEALLKRIDKPAPKRRFGSGGTAPGQPVGGQRAPGLGRQAQPIGLPGPPHYPESANYVITTRTATVRDGWQRLSNDDQDTDKEARTIAQKLRTALKSKGEKHPEVVQLRKSLEDHVNAMFDRSHQVHEQRIQELQRKLQSLQQKVQQQQASREQMVRHRIERLLAGRATSADARRPARQPNASVNISRSPYANLSLNIPDPDGALQLMTQVAETQNRIAKAEAEFEASTAEMERVKAQLEVPEHVSKSERLQLEAEYRIQATRRKATVAEIDAARRLHQILGTQIETYRDLLRNNSEQAKIALSKAQRDLERAASLKENQVISESELDSIQTTLDRARLDCERAETILNAFDKQSN